MFQGEPIQCMPIFIGKKIEMTQHFQEDGSVIPVTLLSAKPNVVTFVQKNETEDFVDVQLGIEEVKDLKKPQAGHLKDLPQVSILRQFRVSHFDQERGNIIEASLFQPGMKIDVIGTSKGRGFAGVMKRHHFAGQPASHGQKDQMRMPGSIASQRQGPVVKGQRMAGHMGTQQVTVKNLEIVFVNTDKQIIAVKGAVPGARGSLVVLKTREGKNVWQK